MERGAIAVFRLEVLAVPGMGADVQAHLVKGWDAQRGTHVLRFPDFLPPFNIRVVFVIPIAASRH
jgi:hypothetical protein